MVRLDEIDLQILDLLAQRGRESWKSLADEVGLSAPSVMERARKLERAGVIRGYSVRLDPEALGLDLLAFVFLVGSGREYHLRLSEQIQTLPEVLECHATSGAYDYLLKVRCTSTRHLMRVLQTLRADPGLKSTDTTVTLASMKESVALPLTSAADSESV